jgi:hypothetical protein
LPSDLDSLDTSGCIFFNDEQGYGHSYIILPKTIIGSNEFAFSIRTYIQIEFRTQLKEVLADELIRKYVSQELIECCCLFDNVFKEILSCLLQSRFLKNKHKKGIQQKINALRLS